MIPLPIRRCTTNIFWVLFRPGSRLFPYPIILVKLSDTSWYIRTRSRNNYDAHSIFSVSSKVSVNTNNTNKLKTNVALRIHSYCGRKQFGFDLVRARYYFGIYGSDIIIISISVRRWCRNCYFYRRNCTCTDVKSIRVFRKLLRAFRRFRFTRAGDARKVFADRSVEPSEIFRRYSVRVKKPSERV